MVGIRTLTLTRPIRRELATCVRQLIQSCSRWPLKVLAHRHDQWVLHLQGWPDGVDIVISVQGLCLRVMHEGQFWDALFWLDVSPDRQNGHWRCIDPDCASGPVHGRLRDLLWEHLCEPLLAYLQQLPRYAQLCLYGGESQGYTFAHVISGNPRSRLEPVRCWPLPELA